MKIINTHYHSLGSESYQVLGFKSEEELNREILKLVQVRSEFLNNTEIITNNCF